MVVALLVVAATVRLTIDNAHMAKAVPKAAKHLAVSAAVASAQRPGIAWMLAVSGLVLAGIVVRIWAAQDEFWLDEIWSLVVFARRIESPLDILTLHWDNNHYLVTFWMYLLKAQTDWFVYRIPSVVAGTGTVILAARIARRWGAFATFAATILTTTSYFLIQYASEARGYAVAGFFALAAFLAMDRYLAKRSAWANISFGLASVLGLLSHLTFVHFYLGALTWSIVSCRKSAPSWRATFGPLLRCHAAPLSFLAALYLIDLRHMQLAGGEPYVTVNVVANTLALAVGNLAHAPVYVFLAALSAAAAAVVALAILWREKSDLCVFFAVTIFLSPAILLLIMRPTFLYERYFYVSYVFLLILFSYLLGKAAERGWTGESLSVVALTIVVLGNVKLTYDLLQVGRGHFLEAMQYLADHNEASDIYIEGDHESRDTAYLHFYVPYVSSGKRFLYHNVTTDKRLLYQNPLFEVPPDSIPNGDEWAIVQNQSRPYRPPPAVVATGRSQEFLLERVYPYAGLSGFNFALFHCRVVESRPPPIR
jgi:Dolichyl-phosphate-mannose-protein mannosyltransferase